MKSPYHGHLTRPDGTHVPLTEDVSKALWEAIERKAKERAAAMPADADALRQLHDAYTRLKELGWKEPRYATRDGECDTISPGCSAIHRAIYIGDWPDGDWWLSDELDTCEPVLVRPV